MLLLTHSFVCGLHLAKRHLATKEPAPASPRPWPAACKRALWRAFAVGRMLVAPLLWLDAAVLLLLPLEPLLRVKPSSSHCKGCGALAKPLRSAHQYAYRHWRQPAAAMCDWLWHYRLARMACVASLQAAPMVVLCAVLLADPWAAGSHAARGDATHGLQGVLVACAVVAGLHMLGTFTLMLVNARASGGMALLRYMSLVATMSGSLHLPLEWQVGEGLEWKEHAWPARAHACPA